MYRSRILGSTRTAPVDRWFEQGDIYALHNSSLREVVALSIVKTNAAIEADVFERASNAACYPTPRLSAPACDSRQFNIAPTEQQSLHD